MCFTSGVSLVTFLFGCGVSLFLHQRHHNTLASSVFVINLMELIQYLQYFYIDDCDHVMNTLLTMIAYVHICFQPWMVTHFLSGCLQGRHSRELAFTKQLCLVTAAALIGRLIIVYDACDQTRMQMCGKQFCSYSGKYHIAWTFRFADPFIAAIPSWYIHLFMCWAPAFVLGCYAFLIPNMVSCIIPYMLIEDINESPAVWCLFCLYTFTFSVMVALTSPKRSRCL
jgi:hypothetical protein